MTQGSQDASKGALAHLRVLDLTSSQAAYAGKLLADLGALVVKVEPPGGDPGRREAPLDEQGRSLPFLYENANKRSVVLDLEEGAGRDRLRHLATQADLLIESAPVGWLDARGLGWADLRGLAPGLVMLSITGFGQDGPLAEARSNDLIASALGGAMVSIGHPEDPPVRMAAHQADVVSATLGVGSALVALRHRDATGRGQHVDVSTLEAVAAATHIAGVGNWLEDGVVPRRVGTGLVASVPSGAYRCRDGLVYLMVNRPAHWQALAEWIFEVTGKDEVLMEEFRGPSSARLPYREFLDLFISELTESMTVDEAYHEGQRRRIAFTPIHTAARLHADAHLAARDFFVSLPREGAEPLRVPGAPYRPERTPWRLRRGAPALDEFAGEVDAALAEASSAATAGAPTRQGTSPSSPDAPPAASSGRALGETARTLGPGALAGLRVVEFGTGLAAPWIGRILAWAGAEVIKIESHGHPDVPRLYVSPRAPERGTQPECSPWFTDWSAGKRFVALDLRHAEGAELARRLVDESDAVLANYSTGALEKLGVGWEVVSARNPRLVMLESSGYGGTGPYARYVTWGPNIEALSGLCHLSGFPERDCTISHFAYPDPLSALHGLVVLMAALAERDRSGRGQRIRLSQWETAVAAIGRVMAEFAATGDEPPRRGNGEPGKAPWGCFPCQGEDRYVVLCCEEEADWPRLRTLLGEPEWAKDERYASMSGRVEHAEELEARLADWTRERIDVEIVAAARALGLAVGAVQTAADLYERDPQLAARGFFEEIPHFKKDRVVASGIPLGLTATPGHTPHAGSSIGHDNEAVLMEILGLDRAEYDRLVSSGAIEPAR